MIAAGFLLFAIGAADVGVHSSIFAGGCDNPRARARRGALLLGMNSLDRLPGCPPSRAVPQFAPRRGERPNRPDAQAEAAFEVAGKRELQEQQRCQRVVESPVDPLLLISDRGPKGGLCEGKRSLHVGDGGIQQSLGL